MKIFLLFYMCHFAMGLTHCYKTTVFFTFIASNNMFDRYRIAVLVVRFYHYRVYKLRFNIV